ncbi:MAG: VOC family protein [Gemmataceae bacterium]
MRDDGGNDVTMNAWQASPVLGVPHVRQAAEYYRDVLGFSLDPVDGVFQPSAAEPGGVYAIVKRSGVWIHLQIRRDSLPPRTRPLFERDVYLYVDDLDILYADLHRRGAVILQPPHLAPHGIRELVVEDLNGYRIACGELDR